MAAPSDSLRLTEKKKPLLSNFETALKSSLSSRTALALEPREDRERENVCIIFASGFGASSRRRRNEGGILEEERILFRDEASASNRREKIIIIVATTTEERGEEEDDLVVVVVARKRFIRRRRRLRRRAFAERSRRGRAVGSETRERVRQRV